MYVLFIHVLNSMKMKKADLSFLRPVVILNSLIYNIRL